MSCRAAGGAWADGTPCRMDAVQGQRCDFHAPGIEAALAAAVRVGMVDIEAGHIVGDPPAGHVRALASTAIARIVEVQADPANDAEVARLLGHVAEYFAHLWAHWDLVSVPGTDASIAQALEHREHLGRLSDEMGVRLTGAVYRVALERYRYEPGKRWPIAYQRHPDDCAQPANAAGRTTCGCPVLFDWEVEDRAQGHRA